MHYVILQRYLLAGFTLATIILFVIAKTTNTLPTTSCGHTCMHGCELIMEGA